MLEKDFRETLLGLFREVQADEKGILPDDGTHCLSTGENIPFLFTDLDVAQDAREALPGRFPYRRGIFPNMYRGRLWTMRQYAGFGTAEESNRRFHFLLERGQTGLSVAFDLPTQMGMDSDDIRARGEVGRVGVAISSVEDMKVLFKDIPLDKVSVSMTINATAPILLAMLQVVAEEQGVLKEALSGTTQNDILKEHIARGTYIFPPKEGLELATDLIIYCSKNLPKWNPISISGYHIREAGADAVQEIGFTLANGITYCKAVMSKGLDVDLFAPRLSFFFGCHNNFFEEIAKFRAARVAWAYLMDRIGAKNQRSKALRFHTQTAGCTLTSQQPLNNIVRVTIQALAAILGGTQSLHTNAMDEALSLPSEESALLALRTQQIIAFESHCADQVDPLGGSYLVEYLTDKMVDKTLSIVDEIEGMGGMVSAIEKGWVQRQIEESAYKDQRAVESGIRKVVGVNCFVEKGGVSAIKPFTNEKERIRAEEIQRERVKEFRKTRGCIDKVLDRVSESALSKQGITEAILDAVRNRATVGEIVKALGKGFGCKI